MADVWTMGNARRTSSSLLLHADWTSHEAAFSMKHMMLAAFTLTLLTAGTLEDGESYLKRAEERMYRWPRPGVVVHFEAQTDVLAPMILMMKRDLAKTPDEEAGRLVEALEHLTIHGTIDTEAGSVTTDVSVPYQSSDPRAEAALDGIKRRVTITISGCFQGLPLSDPSLLHAGWKVSACDESDESILITMAGARPGESTRLKLGRTFLLPETIETPAFTGRYRFEESFPGRFAPSRLDLAPRGGPENHAEYTYQKQGDLLFPARVKVSSRDQSATITFRSLTIERRAR